MMKYEPEEVTHPRLTVIDKLDEMNIPVETLPENIKRILNQNNITEQEAAQIESACAIPAAYLLRHYQAYNQWKESVNRK